MNHYYGYQQTGERSALLPFLAGVLVTTPFIILNKNQNQQYVPVYPPYQPYQPYYPPYYPPQYPIFYR